MKTFIILMVGVASLAVAFVFWLHMTPKELIFADFTRVKADAVALMARAEKEDPSELPIILRQKELPESLRSLPIMYVEVQKDHVRLVEFRCPDYTEGEKIWKDGVAIPADENHPTSYPNVTHFFVDTSGPDSFQKKETQPNQALVPPPASVTPAADASVTPAADAPVAPAAAAAHLSSEDIRR